MPPSRCIKLSEEEDIQLREIEQDPYLRPKVRVRAQVLRLSNRGSNMAAIASTCPPTITYPRSPLVGFLLYGMVLLTFYRESLSNTLKVLKGTSSGAPVTYHREGRNDVA